MQKSFLVVLCIFCFISNSNSQITNGKPYTPGNAMKERAAERAKEDEAYKQHSKLAPKKSTTSSGSSSGSSGSEGTNSYTLPSTTTSAEEKGNFLSELWLTNHVGSTITAEENQESLKTGKELLKLIQSASNNFIGYQGKSYKNAIFEYITDYDVINTEFLHCNDQKISLSQNNYCDYHASFRYNEASKKNIRNIYLSFIKQIPLLSAETGDNLKLHVDDRTHSYCYSLINSLDHTVVY